MSDTTIRNDDCYEELPPGNNWSEINGIEEELKALRRRRHELLASGTSAATEDAASVALRVLSLLADTQALQNDLLERQRAHLAQVTAFLEQLSNSSATGNGSANGKACPATRS
jgi:hypothetical protein